MTTFMTISTDVDGIRQEFADALGLESEWDVPIIMELGIEGESGITERYGREYTWRSIDDVFYSGKLLRISGELHRYLCDQLEKESRHNPAL